MASTATDEHTLQEDSKAVELGIASLSSTHQDMPLVKRRGVPSRLGRAEGALLGVGVTIGVGLLGKLLTLPFKGRGRKPSKDVKAVSKVSLVRKAFPTLWFGSAQLSTVVNRVLCKPCRREDGRLS